MSEQQAWYDFYQIPDIFPMIHEPLQKLTCYLLVFGIMALIHAYVVKTHAYVKKPTNRFNLLLFGIMALLISRFTWIMEQPQLLTFSVLYYFCIQAIAHIMFKVHYMVVYDLKIEHHNVNRDLYIMYHKKGAMCIALQDLRSIVNRIFLNRHVWVEVNATTTMTENYSDQLWICNSAEITDKRLKPEPSIEEEKELKEVLSRMDRIRAWFKETTQTFLVLDVAEAHQVNRYDFIVKVTVLDYLVTKYEKLMKTFTKLRVLLTSLLARKHSKIIVSAMRTFEKALTLTKSETKLIGKIVSEVEGKEKVEPTKKKEGDQKSVTIPSTTT